MTSAFFALSLLTSFAGQDGMVQAPVDPPTAAVGTSVSIDPKLTIEQAADVARQSAYRVLIQKNAAERAQSEIRAAFANGGPQVNASASYQRQEPAQSFGPVSLPNENKSLSLSLSQVIDLSGAVRAGVAAARFLSEAQSALIQSEVSGAVAETRTAYLNALRAQSYVQIQQLRLDSNRGRLRLAEQTFAAGAIARFDVLRLENEVKRAEIAVNEAQSGLELALQALNSAMGRDVTTPIELVAVEGIPSVATDRVALMRLALESRSELRALLLQAEALGQVEKTIAAGTKPQLVGSLTRTQELDAPAGQRDGATIFALQLSARIWDSKATEARVDSARKDRLEAQLRTEQLMLGVALDVNSAVTRFETAQREYALAQDSEELAKEALRLADLLFREGQGILLDVIVAQNDYTTAQLAAAAAYADVWVAYSQVQRAVGADAVNPVTEGTTGN